MDEPFVFRKVLYLEEVSGLRAADLDEFLRLVTLAGPHAIGYHMHRGFLAHYFVRSEYPNDFAKFAATLGDRVAAERLANLRAFRHASLAGVQREIASVLADHLLRNPAAARARAPAGREFVLCSARKFVFETGRRARDLSEFTGVIADVDPASLFYHLFDTRHDEERAERPNDFARWAEESLGQPALAARLSSFDPYMFSIDESRRLLLRILSEAQAGESP